MPLLNRPNFVQFILKISKLCNLRCKYCYEYPFLDDPTSMTHEQLEAMYLSIAQHYRQLEIRPDIHFVWHGGEPLLRPPEFYRQTIRMQRRIFGGDLEVKNFIQTNLVSLTDEKIDLLKNFFDGVGVSIDLFGDLRVNLAGVVRQRAVLENMDRLTRAGLDFGCIVVLSGLNQHKLPQIFEFFARMDLSFRVLPLFAGAEENQHGKWDISANETKIALETLADLWFASESKIDVEPISSHLKDVLRHRAPVETSHYYDRRAGESIIIVSTDGETYSLADVYEPGASWGNIFEQPYAELVCSEGRARSIVRTEQRMANSCTRCEYFGACSGYPIGEDNHAYHELPSGGDECPVVRPLLAHLEARIQEAGFLDCEGFVDIDRLVQRSKISTQPREQFAT